MTGLVLNTDRVIEIVREALGALPHELGVAGPKDLNKPDGPKHNLIDDHFDVTGDLAPTLISRIRGSEPSDAGDFAQVRQTMGMAPASEISLNVGPKLLTMHLSVYPAVVVISFNGGTDHPKMGEARAALEEAFRGVIDVQLSWVK